MPVIVSPGFRLPADVDPVVSPDGRLTVILDAAHAGVLLRADFDDSVPDTPAQPEKVLRRNNVSAPVSQWATSGVAVTDVGGGWNRVTTTIAGRTSYISSPSPYDSKTPVSQGSNEVAIEVRVPADVHPLLVRYGVYLYDANGTEIQAERTLSDYLTLTAGGTQIIRVPFTPSSAVTGARILFYPMDENGQYTVGNVVEVRTPYLGPPGDPFNGDTEPRDGKKYRWTGPANASTSEEYTPATPFIPGKPGTVAKVRFERQDGTIVRSGDPAWAPGGWAHAYDHEATLGGGTSWRAVPILADGTEGTPSDYVTAAIPALTDGYVWLKPVNAPDAAIRLRLEPADLDFPTRLTTTPIAAARHPAVTWDVLQAPTSDMRVLIRDRHTEQQLLHILDTGPILAQYPACAGMPDYYFLPDKLSAEEVHWDGYPWRRWTIGVQPVARPTTAGTPLRIPGLSYDTVARDYTTYDQVTEQVETYNQLLEVG